MVEHWLEEAKNGSPILYIKREEEVWRLNSPYAPEKEAERWANQYEIKDLETPICLFGLGAGYFLQALLEKAKEDTIFLVVEPDRALYEKIKEESLIKTLKQDQRIHLLIGMETETLARLFYQYVDWRNINSSIYCVHPHYEEIYQEEYLIYLKTIRDCQMREDAEVSTTVHHGTKRAENMLKAFQLLPGNTVLKKIPSEMAERVPFVIIAAGPSLDQNIEALKKAKKKAILVAVDRALPTLHKYGIQPDLTVTLDPVKNPKHLSEGDGIPLLCSFASNKKTMEQYNGPLVFYGGYGYIKGLFKIIDHKVPGVDTGGSVATAAFTICKALKIKKVILVGQDLAFKDGKSHAEGLKSKREMKRYQVEDVNGKQIETRVDWYLFLKWFEQEIRQNTWMQVIDATEGGARIEGTELGKLSEVLDELPDMPVSAEQVIEAMQYKVSVEEYQKMLEKPKQDLLELGEIEQCTKEAEELLDQLIRACRNKSIDDPKYTRPIQKLGELNKKIEEYDIMSFLNYYSGGESQKLLAGIYEMGEDDIDSKEKVYKQAKSFYEMYQRNSKKLSEEMQKLFVKEAEA